MLPPIFADARLLENSDFLLSIAFLFVALLGGGVILLWLDRWRKKQAAGEMRSTDALSAYRALYERGELSKGEYELIRGQLAHQMREEIDATLEARKKAKMKGDRPLPPED
jgi:hypothetical protein